MKKIANVFNAGIGFRYAFAAAILFLLLASGPAQANCDYIFFSVNGDTNITVMTQGDMVGWGANCTVGATLHWQIWADVDLDGQIDIDGDRLIFEFDVADGETSGDGPPPDNNPVPDGWYITNEMMLGMAPADYLLSVFEPDSHTGAMIGITCNAMADPPNMIRGLVSVEGHTAPDPEFLGNRWIECSPEGGNFQLWAGLTDENGQYEVNIGEDGTGLEFRVDPPEIAGFAGPGETMVTVSGIVDDIDFYYSAPADSLFGYIRNEYGNLILRNVSGYCSKMNGSGNKNFDVVDGRYVVFFGPSEYGQWNIGISSDNLVPDYMVPMNHQVEIGTIHGQQIDFICIDADTVLYARVTENNAEPSHSYRVIAQSYDLQCGTQAISGIGSENIVPLYITADDLNGWNLGISSGDDSYPIPPGYVLENGGLNDHSPGDTVNMNFVAGVAIRDTVVLDSGDPEPNWNIVWVSIGRDGNYYGCNPNGDGVFTIYADTGVYSMSVNHEGYLTRPNNRQVHITGDTTGGLGFVINQRHCRVSGVLSNIPLPINYSIGVPAYSANDNSGYATMLHVDSLTGHFEGYLCDAEWTLDPPMIQNRFAPQSAHLSIADYPDTVKTLEFFYIDPSGIEDMNPIPKEFSLLQNYPNPFNAQTVISYGLPQAANVTIEIYDLLGRSIVSLPAGTQEAGYHNLEWNASGQPSGIYFYRIKAGDFTQMRKMLLLK
jgi:hypothetical protein